MEGDLIIQGRFGHSLRFGSSLFSNPNATTPQPNLLMTVGQSSNRQNSTSSDSVFSLVFEDINKDSSCIWMVVDEEVVLNPATKNSIAHLRSAELSDSTKYNGAQIFINSDRLIMNSKENEISLFSNAEINLSAVQSITVDSAKSVMITAENDITLTTPKDIVLSGDTISLNCSSDISQGTSGNYTISGKKIFIGSGGDESQPMVLGAELAKWLQELIQALTTAVILTPTGPGAFNPTTNIILATLGSKLGTINSPQSAIFNSTSIFTSKN